MLVHGHAMQGVGVHGLGTGAVLGQGQLIVAAAQVLDLATGLQQGGGAPVDALQAVLALHRHLQGLAFATGPGQLAGNVQTNDFFLAVFEHDVVVALDRS